MARDKGGFKTAYSKIAKWSRSLIPCIPKRNDDENMIQMSRELTRETIDKLRSVLRDDLEPLLNHIRHIVVYRTVNYENGFLTEPPGTIDGESLTTWLMINMDITNTDDAQYTTSLLNGHEQLFTIVNECMSLNNLGYFRRYPTPNSRYDGATESSDFLFACFLCEKIGAHWSDFPIDLSRWMFVYEPPTEDIELLVEDPRAVTPWTPSLWAGPLMNLGKRLVIWYENIGDDWRDLVTDLTQWVFVYVSPEDDIQLQPDHLSVIVDWPVNELIEYRMV